MGVVLGVGEFSWGWGWFLSKSEGLILILIYKIKSTSAKNLMGPDRKNEKFHLDLKNVAKKYKVDWSVKVKVREKSWSPKKCGGWYWS